VAPAAGPLLDFPHRIVNCVRTRRSVMRIGSLVLLTITVSFAACSQSGPAQSAPPPSSSAAAAGSPAPAADRNAAPAGSASAAQPSSGSTQPGADTPAAEKSTAAGREPSPEPAKFHEVTIPIGTVLTAKLSTAIASDTSKVEDPVRARVTQAVSIEGLAAIPVGSSVTGSVITAKGASKFKGHAELSLRFDSLVTAGSDERHNIRTTLVARETAGTGKKSAMKIGLPALGGAVIGGIIGGGKGAAIGAAAGGGAGTVLVLTSDGKEVSLPRGTPLGVKLVDPLTLRIRVSPQ